MISEHMKQTVKSTFLDVEYNFTGKRQVDILIEQTQFG